MNFGLIHPRQEEEEDEEKKGGEGFIDTVRCRFGCLFGVNLFSEVISLLPKGGLD